MVLSEEKHLPRLLARKSGYLVPQLLYWELKLRSYFGRKAEVGAERFTIAKTSSMMRSALISGSCQEPTRPLRPPRPRHRSPPLRWAQRASTSASNRR